MRCEGGDIQLHSVEDKLESEETSIGGYSLAVELWEAIIGDSVSMVC